MVEIMVPRCKEQIEGLGGLHGTLCLGNEDGPPISRIDHVVVSDRFLDADVISRKCKNIIQQHQTHTGIPSTLEALATSIWCSIGQPFDAVADAGAMTGKDARSTKTRRGQTVVTGSRAVTSKAVPESTRRGIRGRGGECHRNRRRSDSS